MVAACRLTCIPDKGGQILGEIEGLLFVYEIHLEEATCSFRPPSMAETLHHSLVNDVTE